MVNGMNARDLYKNEHFIDYRNTFEQKLELKVYSAASKEIERLVEIYPDHPGIHFLAGTLYLKAENAERAKDYLEKALSYEPDNVEYTAIYGRALIELGELEKARLALEKALEIDPNHYQLVVALGYQSIQARDDQRALQYAQQALGLDPDNYESLYLLGLALLQVKESESEAYKYLKKARQFSQNEALDYAIARALFMSGELKESNRICKKSMMKNPNSRFAEKFRELIRRIQHQETTGKIEEKQPINPTSKKAGSHTIKDYMKIFQEIEERTNQVVLGQMTYAKELCVAFLRPYAFGTSKENVRNTLFIAGKRGMGGYKAIKSIAAQMHERKLLRSPSTTVIDLKNYRAGSSDTDYLFLTDIYKALKGNADVIIFEQLETAPPQILANLSQLIVTGKIKLQSRYVYRNGELVELYGRLTDESFDEITANGKYLIFASEKDYNHIQPLLNNDVLEKVKDILNVEMLTNDVLQRVCSRQLTIMQNSLKRRSAS